MKKGTVIFLLFALGIALLFAGIWLQDAVFLDDREKVSETSFRAWQGVSVGSIVLGGIGIIIGFYKAVQSAGNRQE